MEIMSKRLEFLGSLKDLTSTDAEGNDVPYFDLDFLVKKYLKMDPNDLDQNRISVENKAKAKAAGETGGEPGSESGGEEGGEEEGSLEL
jgi:hypothetical protein